MHFRRHFIFSPKLSNIPNENGVIIFDNADECYRKKISLTDDSIVNSLGEADVIMPTTFFDAGGMSVYEQTKHYSDEGVSGYDEIKFSLFEKAIELVIQNHSELVGEITAYLQNNKHTFLNMFILKKNIFFAYSKWLFSITEALEKTHYIETCSSHQARTLAHISERLFGLFIHVIYPEPIKIKQLAISMVQDTTLPLKIRPKFKKKNIAICYASSDEYAKYTATSIVSVRENASPDFFYDVVVLTRDMTIANKQKLQSLQTENFSIRCYNVQAEFNSLLGINDGAISTMIGHVSLDTFSSCLVPILFDQYEKVIVIDSDTVIRDDVSEIYKIDLTNKLLAAANDVEALRIFRTNEDFREYCKNVLELENINNYFQAGFMLLNIKLMNDNNISSKLVEKLQEIGQPLFSEQCLFNAVCQGNVLMLPTKWNVEWHIKLYTPDFYKHLPYEIYNSYLNAFANPSLIHYSSPKKPWDLPDHELANYFWSYARKTPFYELLLQRVMPSRDMNNNNVIILAQQITDIYLKKILHFIVPPKGRRLKLAKKICQRFKHSALLNRLTIIYRKS